MSWVEYMKYKRVCRAEMYRDKTIADKSMHIPNDNTRNSSFCRSKLIFETFQKSTNEPTNQKFPKFQITNNKNVIINFFCVINSLIKKEIESTLIKNLGSTAVHGKILLVTQFSKNL